MSEKISRRELIQKSLFGFGALSTMPQFLLLMSLISSNDKYKNTDQGAVFIITNILHVL